MKNSLSNTGLSLSQAQSISNLCYQRGTEINNNLSGINNATRTVRIGTETFEETVGKPMPTNVIVLLLEKSQLHATQAFLMTNIKAKDEMIKSIQQREFSSDIQAPVRELFVHANLKSKVDETWGWSQLSVAETCEFLEQEAFSAHVGQFIHKDSILDKLRRQLPNIKSLEWITIKDGEKTPLIIKTHHTSDQLLDLHEELATLHRGYEMRVNYFKAKVKNLVTDQNAKIAKENAIEQDEVNGKNLLINVAYEKAMKEVDGIVRKLVHEFEVIKEQDIRATAALRISVDPRFQETVNRYLANLDKDA